MKNLVVCLFILGMMGCTYGQENKDLKLIHKEIVSYLQHPDSCDKLFFRCEEAVALGDSFTVIAADSMDNDWLACAVINHNKYSRGHEWVSDEMITRWKEDRWYSASYLLEGITAGGRKADSAFLEGLKGYWIYVRPYCGEFYIDNDWTSLRARELTDSTWVQIDMEVFPRAWTELEGNKERFTLWVEGDPWVFELMEPEREIYKVGRFFMVPNRRKNDFKIIEYIGTTGDLILPFVKFDASR